jgi:hypothetical protein
MFFNKDGLAKQTPKRPIATGEIFFENMKWVWRDLPHGRIFLYERPEKSEQYVISGDASEAVGSDEAASLVLNKRMNSTSATISGQYTPEELAQMLIGLGHYFNEGKIAQENKGYGYQVNQLVYQNYGNVYRRIIDKDGVQVEKDELGFNTNTVTRPQALAMMAEEISHNSTTLNSKELISECRTFIIKKDKDGKVTKVEAQNGYQDGLVICRAIAGYVRNQEPYRPEMGISATESKQRAAVDNAIKPKYGFKH